MWHCSNFVSVMCSDRHRTRPDTLFDTLCRHQIYPLYINSLCVCVWQWPFRAICSLMRHPTVDGDDDTVFRVLHYRLIMRTAKNGTEEWSTLRCTLSQCDCVDLSINRHRSSVVAINNLVCFSLTRFLSDKQSNLSTWCVRDAKWCCTRLSPPPLNHCTAM